MVAEAEALARIPGRSRIPADAGSATYKPVVGYAEVLELSLHERARAINDAMQLGKGQVIGSGFHRRAVWQCLSDKERQLYICTLEPVSLSMRRALATAADSGYFCGTILTWPTRRKSGSRARPSEKALERASLALRQVPTLRFSSAGICGLLSGFALASTRAAPMKVASFSAPVGRPSWSADLR